MGKEITISLDQLEWLLLEQKRLVIEKLLSITYYYNTESTTGCYKHIENIDKELFKEAGFKTKAPSDLEILKRYIK